jgi:hypothetical protein
MVSILASLEVEAKVVVDEPIDEADELAAAAERCRPWLDSPRPGIEVLGIELLRKYRISANTQYSMIVGAST